MSFDATLSQLTEFVTPYSNAFQKATPFSQAKVVAETVASAYAVGKLGTFFLPEPLEKPLRILGGAVAFGYFVSNIDPFLDAQQEEQVKKILYGTPKK